MSYSTIGWFAVAAIALVATAAPPQSPIESKSASFKRQIIALEHKTGGRLGVSVLNLASGERFNYRADERFPMCSTFKLLAAGAALARVDRGEEHLDRAIAYTAKDLLPNSPITTEHVSVGHMTVQELCQAAMTRSDNTAANLLIASLGGPKGVTSFAQTLGDTKTHLDRKEPELNDIVAGDERDTTTPANMLADLRKLVLGPALTTGSRALITQWLIDNLTGPDRLRAGLPATWKVGDRTGSGSQGTANDIAIAWPPHRPPVLICVYITGSKEPSEQRLKTIAEGSGAGGRAPSRKLITEGMCAGKHRIGPQPRRLSRRSAVPVPPNEPPSGAHCFLPPVPATTRSSPASPRPAPAPGSRPNAPESPQ